MSSRFTFTKKMWYPRTKLVEALEELESQSEHYAGLSENSTERIEWELAKADLLIAIGLIDVFRSKKEQRIKDVIKSNKE